MTDKAGNTPGATIAATLDSIRQQGLFKEERVISTPQGSAVHAEPGGDVINLCANNYLGLANHPRLIAAAKQALDSHGLGLASVRFICGTQDLHKELEKTISRFLGLEDTILYTSCFDANGGLFETLLGGQDAVISDALNHASIIDGIRLSKAMRYRYEHADMDDLEERLNEAERDGAQLKLVATDGVFSMDGDIARLDQVVAVAKRHGAWVMVDDSHATGFVGKTGRGSREHCGVMDGVDIVTTTLGKAMGGASGGCISGRADVIALLRQRSRPYLFSNTLAPPLVAAGIEAFTMLSETTALRDKLEANTALFRERMTQADFDIRPGVHPIVPIMLYNAKLAQDFARDLLAEGVYVIGFFYPVVPLGQARIRVQVSAAHDAAQLSRAIDAFTKVGEKYGVLGKSKDEIVARYGA